MGLEALAAAGPQSPFLGEALTNRSFVNCEEEAMGVHRFPWIRVSLLAFLLILVAAPVSARATDTGPLSLLTVVTIKATDPIASEKALDPGELTVYRGGGAVNAVELTVYYKVSGSATNGVDYRELAGKVVIPRGAASAKIPILPIDDTLREGTETVVVTLVEPACIAIYPPPPDCYRVGFPRTATVSIYDDD